MIFYPFKPCVAMPLTKNFYASKKTTMVGITIIIVPAIIIPHSLSEALAKSIFPNLAEKASLMLMGGDESVNL